MYCTDYFKAIVQVMLELGSGSLILVSCFGLFDGLAVTATGPLAGAYIDRYKHKASSIPEDVV